MSGNENPTDDSASKNTETFRDALNRYRSYTRYKDDDEVSGVTTTSDDQFDTISTASDYIVIDTSAKKAEEEASRIRINKYSYPSNAYLPGGDGTSEDDASDVEETEEESEIESVIQNPAYNENVKAAVSVEDELDQRKQQEAEQQDGEAGGDSNDEDSDSEGSDDEGDDSETVVDSEAENAKEDEEEDSIDGQQIPSEADPDRIQASASSPLILAVKNDTPHLIEGLLDESNNLTIYASLLYSIILGRDHITKMFLDHHSYQALKEINDLAKLGQMPHTEDEQKDEATEQILTAEFTPLMMASVKNQFEIVQGMMSKGETIEEPHPLGCSCDTCRLQTDEIKAAKNRINTYRALCSDAYVVLASMDPIYRTFELGQKLTLLADEEKHFKAEYLQLAEHCSKLSARILDHVRDGSELDILLNEKYGAGPVASDLARLKLAIRYQEKSFVAHPTCQKILATMWLGNLNPNWVSSPLRAVIFVFCLGVCYPFIACGYWLFPRGKIADFLQTPIVKFSSSTISYLAFIAILITSSVTEQLSDGFLLSEEPNVGTLYTEYLETSDNILIEDVYVRFHAIRTPTILLILWLMGMMWESMKKIIYEGSTHFTDNLFNLLNFIMLSSYITAFVIRFIAIGQVNNSLAYFSKRENWFLLSQNDSAAITRLYWLDADRRSWSTADLQVISEVFYAMGSLLSIYKMTYSFTISERVGPLLLSLAKMVEDVFAFMLLFIFIIAAFVVAFHNLYWSHYDAISFGIEQPAGSTFRSIANVIYLFFWSIFGLVEMDEGTFDTVNPGQVTSITGQSFFAIYNWVMIIIMINMLIAMMSRSYDIISDLEDTEWKFARTKLYLEFMRDDCTLAAPFNLLPTWKGIRLLYKKFADNICYRLAGRKPPKKNVKGKGGSKKRKSQNNDIEMTPKLEDDIKKNNGDVPSQKSNGDLPTTVKFEETVTPNGGVPGKHTTALTDTENGITDGATGKEDPPAVDKGKKSKKGKGKRKGKAKFMRSRRQRKKLDEPKEEYKKIMGEVVTRFTQKSGDLNSDEGGIEQLQVDLSTLRQEMMSNIFRQDRERAVLKAKVDQIHLDVLKSRKVYTRQHTQFEDVHENRVQELKRTLDFLDNHLGNVLVSMTQTMSTVREKVVDEINDTKVRIKTQMDSVRSGMDDINQGINRHSTQVSSIQSTLMQQVSSVGTLHGTLAGLVSDVTNVQGTLEETIIRPRHEVEAEQVDDDTVVIS